MNKLATVVLVAASVAATGAQSASAAEAPGPCEQQRALFEKYDIQLNMDAPAVAWAYNTACGVTG